MLTTMTTTPADIARRLTDSIRSGKLRPGEKLPSIRAQAKDYGGSPWSVYLAYRMLVREGLVCSAQRGAYVVAARGERRILKSKMFTSALHLREAVRTAIRRAREAGMDDQEIKAVMIEEIRCSKHDQKGRV